MLRSILKTINSVRYGNIYERVNDETFSMLPNFAQSINSMIDAISDREDMIKEYQNDLNKKIDGLKEVEQLKEDFVATLTHDLKVPIMAEKNMLSFLLDNRFGELNEKQKEAVSHLKNSNQELVELVQILLETYKIKETGIKLLKENILLNGFLTDIINETQPIATNSGITIYFEPTRDIKVTADRIQLQRVIKNLISNASSHSNTKDRIDITTGEEPGFITISVIDYGQGIPADEIKLIFNKYYSAAKKFRKIGTGLGLYLSQQIVKSHGGEILVTSEENVRTEFRVKLPL